MENSRPGPEDTDKSRAAKAEGIAAWLHRKRNAERRNILSLVEDEEDDEEEGKSKKKRGKDSVTKHVPRLKLGALPLGLEEDKKAKAQDGVTLSEVKDDEPAKDKAKEDLAGVTAEALEHQVVQEHDVREPDIDASKVEQDFQKWEQEMAGLTAEEEEDFKKWGAELRLPDLEAGSADMQMDGEAPKTTATSASDGLHNPRTAPPARVYDAAAVRPPETQSGRGGDVPPIDRDTMAPGSPDDPRQPYEGSQGVPRFSPNVMPPQYDAASAERPSHVESHEHRHGHPRLALAMLAGLLVEGSFRRKGDRLVRDEMRERTDKLRKQIERSQTTQNQARRSMEAQQLRLEAEQNKQHQAIEFMKPVMNAERTAATGQFERGGVPAARVEAPVPQTVEQPLVVATDRFAEAHVRPRAVMEQAVAAAEYDVPVERVYERRQEVKDDPSVPAGAAGGGAASVGSILTKSPSRQSTAPADGVGAASRQGVSTKSHGLDYRAAAVRGIGAAIALIALALLAYLLL